MEKGAGINAKDKNGRTPLTKSVRSGDKETVIFLIAKNADVNTKYKSKTGIELSSLHFTALAGYEELTEILIKNGADVNAKNSIGMSPLHFATAMSHKKIAELIIENGADVNTKDNNGITPVQIANKKGLELMAAFLLENGAKD